MPDEEFDGYVNDEIRIVMVRAIKSRSKGTHHTSTSGVYEISYVNRGRTHGGKKAQLSFVDNEEDDAISGEVRDADGMSSIDEGFASYDGKAYWMDRCFRSSSNYIGMSVLNKGTFDFENEKFEGEWNPSSDVNGDYCSFYFLKEEPAKEEITSKGTEEGIAVVATSVPGETFDVHPKPENEKPTGSSLFDQIQGTLKRK